MNQSRQKERHSPAVSLQRDAYACAEKSLGQTGNTRAQTGIDRRAGTWVGGQPERHTHTHVPP